MESLLKFVEAIYPTSNQLKFHLKNSIREKRVSKNELILKAGHTSRNIY